MYWAPFIPHTDIFQKIKCYNVLGDFLYQHVKVFQMVEVDIDYKNTVFTVYDSYNAQNYFF